MCEVARLDLERPIDKVFILADALADARAQCPIEAKVFQVSRLIDLAVERLIERKARECFNAIVPVGIQRVAHSFKPEPHFAWSRRLFAR